MTQEDIDRLFPVLTAVTLQFCKTHPLAAIPRRTRDGDAGFDVFACEDALVMPGQVSTLMTGVRIKVAEGFVALVCPRSGLSARHGVTVHNAPGVIDQNFTGELGVILKNDSSCAFSVRTGDRIAQLVVLPILDIETVEVSEEEFNSIATNRGQSGFGSSGR